MGYWNLTQLRQQWSEHFVSTGQHDLVCAVEYFIRNNQLTCGQCELFRTDLCQFTPNVLPMALGCPNWKGKVVEKPAPTHRPGPGMLRHG
jgi:hypothetical protein